MSSLGLYLNYDRGCGYTRFTYKTVQSTPSFSSILLQKIVPWLRLSNDFFRRLDKK
jgi:hypothetical protein